MKNISEKLHKSSINDNKLCWGFLDNYNKTGVDDVLSSIRKKCSWSEEGCLGIFFTRFFIPDMLRFSEHLITGKTRLKTPRGRDLIDYTI